MEYTKIINGNICTVTMDGKFTFSDHKEFKNLLNLTLDVDIKNIQLDISGIEFIDSAGMGLFLLMKDEAAKKSILLTLLNPKGQVKKMFDISKFNTLFHIE